MKKFKEKLLENIALKTGWGKKELEKLINQCYMDRLEELAEINLK